MKLDSLLRWLLTVDAAVRTVRPPAHLGGAVHLDVLDNQVVRVQTLSKQKAHHNLREIQNAALQSNQKQPNWGAASLR